MRILVSASVVVLAASILTAVPLQAAADPIPDGVTAAFGGIVSVRVREIVSVPVFRNGRFLREPVEGLGAGSGVVMSADGLILTNAHVVAGSTEVTIGTTDGREVPAQVVSLDEASDLALLRATTGSFHPIDFGPDTLPASGTPLFVLGNRSDLGLQLGWARMGEHDRVRVGARPLEFWAEVLAPVGPGDSGGALVDAAGRLVGVPSLLITHAGDAGRSGPRSSGLFIPARHARRSMTRMLQGARAAWPWIGVLLEDPFIAQTQGEPWDPARGAVVRRVFPGSPASEAGARPGDRIVAIGGRPARDNFEALDAALDLETGREATVTVERDGRSLDLKMTPAPRPADPRPDPIDDFALHTGFRLRPKDPGGDGRGTLALASMSSRTRRDLPEFEAVLFDERPALVSILPGQNALAGLTRRLSVLSADDLEAIIGRCFVEEQFVALAHWDFGSRKTLDRAHVHRKIYPVVL